ncbi:hypothetical protein LCGC14_1849320 [marine sediment metagenome]|uniref:Uncharacterized protein n=1 Tax=marine sediment metagenome TaxID=412755 RepID=A0A0F9GB23_9ZZZZ|nr:hypothetical protein [bacterium]
MKTVNKIYWGLRILVIIGWLTFFFYNLHVVRFLGQEYNKDPSNFVFFDSEQHRESYKTTIIFPKPWIDEASLIGQCKPAVYMNDFYFSKIDPILRWVFLLIILTIAIRIPPEEWVAMKDKINKWGDKIEIDD